MNFLATPVSYVMKFWHHVLALVVDGDSGLAWAGSVVLLVVTVRLLLMRSMFKQQYSMRKMAQLGPQMKEIQLKYKNSPDKQAQAQEMQKLYTEAGVNPMAGCLPMLVQIPVFFGLYHVLSNFAPRDVSIEQASQSSNGAFGPEQVSSFLHAEVFGVPLSAYIRMPQTVIDSLHPGLGRESILLVAVPLFVLAGVATFLNMWNSFRRQEAAKRAEKAAIAEVELQERAGGPVVEGRVAEPETIDVGDGVRDGVGHDTSGVEEKDAAAQEDSTKDSAAQDAATKDSAAQDSTKDPAKGPDAMPSFAESLQESMASSMKTMMYLFPFFPIVGAVFFNFPIAIGLYWLTNNIWTAVQSHFFMEKLEKELPMSSKEGLPPSAFL